MNRQYRTDRHRNPVAFTTDIARQAGLVKGTDYKEGDPFSEGRYHTATLLGDPVATTIRVIDAVGFYTKSGGLRWIYIGIPDWLWKNLDSNTKRRVIGFMYRHEGGTGMRELFCDPKPE